MNILLCSEIASIKQALIALENEEVLKICATASFSEKKDSNFAESTLHLDLGNTIKEGLRGDFSSVDLTNITPDILGQLAPSENIVFSMMERLDSKRSQTYLERKFLYHYLLCYWLCFFRENRVEVVVFGSSPHEVTDYVMYLICNYLKIKCLIFNYTSLPGFCFLSSKVGFPDQDFGCVARKGASTVDEAIKSYVRRVKGDYSTAIPVYMKEALEVPSKCLSLSKVVFPVFKRCVSLLMEGVPGLKRLIDRKIAKDDWRGLKTEYENLSTDFRKPRRFVYFLLNFQPEITTSPLGGRFVDQYLAVGLLRRCLPEDIVIVVKEHPVQLLDFGHYNHIGRDRNYYRRLVGMKNVVLAPTNVDHFDLVDSSICVASVNGTVGWEAVVRGKHSIVFGEAWYRNAPGVFNVGSEAGCLGALEKIVGAVAIAEQDVLTFLEGFVAQCSRLYLTEDEARFSNQPFDFEDNVNRVKILLQKKIFSGAEHS